MRFFMVLYLQDYYALIEEYLAHQRDVWPEIIASIRELGIQDVELYQVEDSLAKLIQTEAEFSFANKTLLDEQNPTVPRWEALMSKFQKSLRNTPSREK